MEYGFGLYLDILDHDIKDPNLMEDKIRINAGIEYTDGGFGTCHQLS